MIDGIEIAGLVQCAATKIPVQAAEGASKRIHFLPDVFRYMWVRRL